MRLSARLKLYFLGIMKQDQKSGTIFDKILKIVLLIISKIYEFLLNLINFFYMCHVFSAAKAAIPVISVGNIVLGGTGKTPFTVYLAGILLKDNKHPSVLMRGYGDDEYKITREKLKSVNVFVGKDRVKSSKEALIAGADAVILDDGFQYRRLRRDLNIVLIDAKAPFGNGYLFPRGILREPKTTLNRAHIVVITRADRIGETARAILVNDIKRYAPDASIVTSAHKAECFVNCSGEIFPVNILKNKKIYALSGIAEPDYFVEMIVRLSGCIIFRADYPDHYDYSQNDIDFICEKAVSADIDFIVTTEKDYVKIQEFDLKNIARKFLVLRINLSVLEGEEKIRAGLNSLFFCNSH
ncbi:Tetraacyldisaccharide-1-P 4'-kinase [Candidatus Omnitrophus magneticus]|uniref:Tetraacyldisaccharide 4'-kinase n=1 Tax=Candidatus Omnitrophus magneticus TaxID=1609969 RepID=A0A0F0CX57_9BACT|nr:Tetraacyldisaccharide-1-P 4'-kinase [Candidatus Omnitrophus magneticus]